MAINIFEGSRRIALLAAALATVGTLFALVTYDPYVSNTYSISHPMGAFTRMESECPSDAGRHYFTAKTKLGKEASITLCMLAMSFGKNGDRLIPYKADADGTVWGAASYSSEVSAYERVLEKRFSIPLGDDEMIGKEISKRYWENLFQGLGYLVLGLAVFAGMVWAIGWIARGFLGVPRGMDRRPN